jgi:hypothetical protein
MEKILNSQYDERVEQTESGFRKVLEDISTNLTWVTQAVCKTHIIIPTRPRKETKDLMSGQLTLTESGSYEEYQDYIDVVSTHGELADQDAARQCYRDADRFVVLTLPGEDRASVIPTFYTAQKGLLARRGCDCPSINGSPAITRPIESVEEAFLNDSARRCKSFEKWALLDGGAIANSSLEYVTLDALAGYDAFVKNVRDKWPTAEYKNGVISYEGYICDYDLKDKVAASGFKQLLKKLKVKVKDVSLIVRYQTSDTTTSAMAAYLYAVLDGTPMRLSSGIRLEHKGEASIEKFDEMLVDLGMLVDEAEEKVEALGNTDIKNPADCLENALRRVHLMNSVGKSFVENIQPNIAYTALDIVIACSDAFQYAIQADPDKWTLKRQIDMSENIARLLNCKFSDLDKPIDR